MNKRILLIEPSPVLHTLFHLHLRKAGHSVIITTDAVEGLLVLRGLGQTVPHLVLISMRELGNAERSLIAAIKQHPMYRDTITAVILPFDDTALCLALQRLGVKYLCQPVEIQQVMRLVGDVSGASLSQTRAGW